MSRWILALSFCLATAGAAAAQVGNGVNSGVASNNGVINGPNIDRVNGINPNGTPKQQSPGSSMTVGAGNSTMIPGIAGGANAPTTAPQKNGIVTPTINGKPVGTGQ